MKQYNRITSISLALFIGMLTFSAVAASDLTQLKADGLIGEQLNGYIGLVREDVPADVKALVDEVNAKRKAGYQAIATKQGVDVTEVEKVGANTAIEKTLEGNYVRDASGTWMKK